MDTKLNIPANKKVVRVTFPNLQEKGFGWDGSFTREAWRKACLDNLLAGKDQFAAWQASWGNEINEDLPFVSQAATFIYDDKTTETVLGLAFQVQMSYALDYVAHRFEDDVDANGFTFEQFTYFNSATFAGDSDFKGVLFKTIIAEFTEVTFNGNASFSDATFTGDAYFSRAKFDFDAYFNNVSIEQLSYFDRTTFAEYANFTDAKFEMDAHFDAVTFSEHANFENAIFTGDASFSSATFTGDASFKLTTFKSGCHFENSFDEATKEWTKETNFAGVVDFENAVFKNVGHFERVRFAKHTPAFRGCQIDNTRLEFSDDTYFPRHESSEDAVKNISFLKRLADEHGQTDQSLNFNAMELKAKRKLIEPRAAYWSFKAMTWLYEKVSDYGRSFLRPLLGYAALIVCSLILTLPFTDYSQDATPVALANRALCQPKDKDEAAKLLLLTHGRAAFEYAMFRAGGVLDFTDTGKQNNTVNCTLFGQPIEPPFMRAWGIFKGIASIALLFLAALGLRNKYRIK